MDAPKLECLYLCMYMHSKCVYVSQFVFPSTYICELKQRGGNLVEVMNRFAGAITRTMKVPGPGAEMFKVIVPLETGSAVLVKAWCDGTVLYPHVHPNTSTHSQALRILTLISSKISLLTAAYAQTSLDVCNHNAVFGVPL